jgi:glycosyltransferase involved in cell wall biosynthesis
MRVLFILTRFKFRHETEAIPYFSSDIKVEAFIAHNPPVDIPSHIESFKPDIVWTDWAAFAFHVPDPLPVLVKLRGDWWTEFRAAVPPEMLSAFLNGPSYAQTLAGFEKARRILPGAFALMKRVQFRFPHKRFTVTQQGVDGTKYQALKRKGLLKHPSVSIVQSHAIRPKFEGLLQFASVIKKMPDWHFYVATGQSEFEPQTYLPRFQEALIGCRNVHFIDVHTPEEVNALNTESDVYVLATGLDFCPTSLLEAGLMARPAVASRIEGVTECIQEGVNAFTAANGNVDEWIDAIKRAQDLDPREVRRYIVEHFDWTVMAPRLERIFREELA